MRTITDRTGSHSSRPYVACTQGLAWKEGWQLHCLNTGCMGQGHQPAVSKHDRHRWCNRPTITFKIIQSCNAAYPSVKKSGINLKHQNNTKPIRISVTSSGTRRRVVWLETRNVQINLTTIGTKLHGVTNEEDYNIHGYRRENLAFHMVTTYWQKERHKTSRDQYNVNTVNMSLNSWYKLILFTGAKIKTAYFVHYTDSCPYPLHIYAVQMPLLLIKRHADINTNFALHMHTPAHLQTRTIRLHFWGL